MRIMRLKDVMKVTGLGRSTIYKYISEGQFPEQISLGARAVGWVDSEIDDWVMSKIDERGVGGRGGSII